MVIERGYNILLFFVSLSAIILLWEIELRILSPPSVSDAGIISAPMYMNDEQLGWKLKPHFKGVQENPAYKIDILLNGDGYRSEWMLDDIVKKSDAKKILGIGGSFTFGFGVQENETYLRLLEKGLNEKRDEKYLVYNTGVPGYSFKEYCKLLEKFREYLKYFDIIIIGVSINDHTDAALPHPKYKSYNGYLISYKNKSRDQDTNFQNRIKLFAYKHSYFFRGVAKAKINMAHLFDRDDNADDKIGLRAARDAWNNSIHYIDRIRKIAGYYEIPVIIIRIPHRKEIHKDERRDAHIDESLFANLGVWLQEYSQKNGLYYVDTLPTLNELKRDHSVYYLEYDAHWNNYGHKAAAKAILDTINFSTM